MRRIKIYIDEDAMDSDGVAALRSRGVTVITAWDAGLAEKADDEQLAFATTVSMRNQVEFLGNWG